jgi:hypothetical protein
LPAIKGHGQTIRRNEIARPCLLQPVSVSHVRNLIERFFNKIKQGRATRHDKLAANYLAFVKLASIRI